MLVTHHQPDVGFTERFTLTIREILCSFQLQEWALCLIRHFVDIGTLNAKKVKVICFVLLFSASLIARAQAPKRDTIKYVLRTDQYGISKRVPVAYATEILVVSGDSLFSFSNDNELQKKIESQKGFTIISHPDSVRAFLQNRFKAILILKPDD